MAVMHRHSSPLDHFRHHGQASWTAADEQPEPTPANAEPLEYFWLLVQASCVAEIDSLWGEFRRRSLDLKELGQSEDLHDVAGHLVRALDENPAWDRHRLTSKKSAVLRAIAAVEE
jgi:hypothetical protein